MIRHVYTVTLTRSSWSDELCYDFEKVDSTALSIPGAWHDPSKLLTEQVCDDLLRTLGQAIAKARRDDEGGPGGGDQARENRTEPESPGVVAGGETPGETTEPRHLPGPGREVETPGRQVREPGDEEKV